MASVRYVGVAICAAFHMVFREKKPIESLLAVLFQTVSPWY